MIIYDIFYNVILATFMVFNILGAGVSVKRASNPPVRVIGLFGRIIPYLERRIENKYIGYKEFSDFIPND